MTTEELKQLAGQLSRPEGEYGISVSEMMNETNSTMTRHAITRLELSAQDHILELGHGNAGHIPYIMEQATGIIYTGLEISELMHSEAQRINKETLHATSFTLYDGQKFPFADSLFDKAFTVNTIYFWPDPLLTLTELYRVLKPGATLCITYGEEAFMKQLPFTQFGFTLYTIQPEHTYKSCQYHSLYYKRDAKPDRTHQKQNG
jgi:ubiquinone/menaquinone biosynthesis C-methylase UbiE